jgi:hypothetical protein
MPKHFSDFPEELEQYSPELLQFSNFANIETFDSENLHHSYNDEPALILEPYEDGEHGYIWYNHDEIFRENNKSPKIYAKTDSSYTTHNEKGQIASYDDQPANIIYIRPACYLWVEWYKDGVCHRDNDLPAAICWEAGIKSETLYYQNGLIHRENGLPAHIGRDFSKWMVNGGLHNTEGAAYISSDPKQIREPFIWSLFGVDLPQDVFNSIRTYHKQTGIPLWAAFLDIFGVITQNDEKFFEEDMKTWNFDFSLEWQLRALGINEKTFNDRINSYFHLTENFSFVIGSGPYPFGLFKSIIEIELKNATPRNSKEKVYNA